MCKKVLGKNDRILFPAIKRDERKISLASAIRSKKFDDLTNNICYLTTQRFEDESDEYHENLQNILHTITDLIRDKE